MTLTGLSDAKLTDSVRPKREADRLGKSMKP